MTRSILLASFTYPQFFQAVCKVVKLDQDEQSRSRVRTYLVQILINVYNRYFQDMGGVLHYYKVLYSTETILYFIKYCQKWAKIC